MRRIPNGSARSSPGRMSRACTTPCQDENTVFWVKTTKSEPVATTEDIAPGVGAYIYYNDTDVAEDAVLFEEELHEGYTDDMPFVGITNSSSNSMPPARPWASSTGPSSNWRKRCLQNSNKYSDSSESSWRAETTKSLRRLPPRTSSFMIQAPISSLLRCHPFGSKPTRPSGRCPVIPSVRACWRDWASSRPSSSSRRTSSMRGWALKTLWNETEPMASDFPPVLLVPLATRPG